MLTGRLTKARKTKLKLVIGSIILICLCVICPNIVNNNSDKYYVPTQPVQNIKTREPITVTASLTSTATMLPLQTDSPNFTATTIFRKSPTTTLSATAIPSVTKKGIIGAACIPTYQQEIARVIRITDGDTIRVVMNGKEYKVRYIGMDTPEMSDDIFASASSNYNSNLVFGKEIVMFKDVSDTDRYGRLLRYVVVDDLFVNFELVKNGYAYAFTYPPDVACAKTFSEAQRSATELGLGLWGLLMVPTPQVESTTAILGNNNCDPSYPDVCIPPSPPDLDCGDIPYKRFKVLPPDPHRFDRDRDGIGCEG
ncbi:MAG: nuclease [Anaerolinea sp.]|nr:nuclease [Anaerolinea sp.]